jgi:hypothetical protein
VGTTTCRQNSRCKNTTVAADRFDDSLTDRDRLSQQWGKTSNATVSRWIQEIISLYSRSHLAILYKSGSLRCRIKSIKTDINVDRIVHQQGHQTQPGSIQP